MRKLVLCLLMACAASLGFGWSQAAKLTVYFEDQGAVVFYEPNDGVQSNLFIKHLSSGKSYARLTGRGETPVFEGLEPGAYAISAWQSDMGLRQGQDPRTARSANRREFNTYVYLNPGEDKVIRQAWSALPIKDASESPTAPQPMSRGFYALHDAIICGEVESKAVMTSGGSVDFNVLAADADEADATAERVTGMTRAALEKEKNAIRSRLSPAGVKLFDRVMGLATYDAKLNAIDEAFGLGTSCMENPNYEDAYRECQDDLAEFGMFSGAVRELIAAQEKAKSIAEPYKTHARLVRDVCREHQRRVADLEVVYIRDIGPAPLPRCEDGSDPLACVKDPQRLIRHKFGMRRIGIGADTSLKVNPVRLGWGAAYELVPTFRGLKFDDRRLSADKAETLSATSVGISFGATGDVDLDLYCHFKLTTELGAQLFRVALEGEGIPDDWCNGQPFTFPTPISNADLWFTPVGPQEPICMAGAQLFVEVTADGPEDRVDNNRQSASLCDETEDDDAALKSVEILRKAGAGFAIEPLLRPSDMVKVRVTFDGPVRNRTPMVDLRAFHRIEPEDGARASGPLYRQGQVQPIGAASLPARRTDDPRTFETDPIDLSTLGPDTVLRTNDEVLARVRGQGPGAPEARLKVWGIPDRLVRLAVVDAVGDPVKTVTLGESFVVEARFETRVDENVTGRLTVESAAAAGAGARFDLKQVLDVPLYPTKDRLILRSRSIKLNERDEPFDSAAVQASPSDSIRVALGGKGAIVSVLASEPKAGEGTLIVRTQSVDGKKTSRLVSLIDSEQASRSIVSGQSINLDAGTYEIHVPYAVVYRRLVRIASGEETTVEVGPIGRLEIAWPPGTEVQDIVLLRKGNDGFWSYRGLGHAGHPILLPPGQYEYAIRGHAGLAGQDLTTPPALRRWDLSFTIEAGKTTRLRLPYLQ